MNYAHAALRRGRRSLAGHAYLVTFTTARRRALFADWRLGALAAATLADPAQWQASRLLAWVLMPDHWHGLFVLGAGDTLPRRIGWLKAESARRLGIAFPDAGPIWARAYHDRAVRADEDLRHVARYVICNPMRARLVQQVGDFPFWDAAWLGHEQGPDDLL